MNLQLHLKLDRRTNVDCRDLNDPSCKSGLILSCEVIFWMCVRHRSSTCMHEDRRCRLCIKLLVDVRYACAENWNWLTEQGWTFTVATRMKLSATKVELDHGEWWFQSETRMRWVRRHIERGRQNESSECRRDLQCFACSCRAKVEMNDWRNYCQEFQWLSIIPRWGHLSRAFHIRVLTVTKLSKPCWSLDCVIPKLIHLYQHSSMNLDTIVDMNSMRTFEV